MTGHYPPEMEISIHAPHAGRDDTAMNNAKYYADFNPRAPCGARPEGNITQLGATAFQSTRPMRGATLAGDHLRPQDGISIHAPHAGRDIRRRTRVLGRNHFNPRAPCGARLLESLLRSIYLHFNPRAPRGARPAAVADAVDGFFISIHAPREGRDCWEFLPVAGRDNFNPRAPRGARPHFQPEAENGKLISIHAPREGRDKGLIYSNMGIGYISIHAPREGRDLDTAASNMSANNFNPRAPRGARPVIVVAVVCFNAISIHAPREGRDVKGVTIHNTNDLFQSTRPARGATFLGLSEDDMQEIFQSTRPARGATERQVCGDASVRNFNPRAPRGARRQGKHLCRKRGKFQSTRPARGATRSPLR